ncbi:uncharacterized protein LOC125545788 [Triticum urartu]|uniref:uncharacterized protein LOC125545788 n=1 Tax=Triticum urartu TaxID=4572 RepID=UPI002043E532|nr:uncharacterized protein LOC125545788 [Triticum urartu]
MARRHGVAALLPDLWSAEGPSIKRGETPKPASLVGGSGREAAKWRRSPPLPSFVQASPAMWHASAAGDLVCRHCRRLAGRPRRRCYISGKCVHAKIPAVPD